MYSLVYLNKNQIRTQIRLTFFSFPISFHFFGGTVAYLVLCRIRDQKCNGFESHRVLELDTLYSLFSTGSLQDKIAI